jgi:branched-chain amino acid transport system ATP-binding protein
MSGRPIWEATEVLEVQGLSCGYGTDVVAVHDLDLDVGTGEVFALIGPNGAGKSSTIMSIAGHVTVLAGDIRFRGVSLCGVPVEQRVRRGVALVPEGRRLFPDLTVLENLQIGGYTTTPDRRGPLREQVFGYFPRLAERRGQLAGSLSGGEQQMLAIGRAIMAEPKLLMIDELSLGLMPKMVDVCYRALSSLRNEGVGILLVEQNTDRAMQFADRVCVLESGHAAWHGSAQAARSDADFGRRYLGMVD